MSLLTSSNKNIVLFCSFLNFLLAFCKLQEQYSCVWNNFTHPREFNLRFCDARVVNKAKGSVLVTGI